jgi:PAS domain S-box-containing protein
MEEKGKKTEISLNKLSILKQTRSFLENIMESSMDGIVLTDSKGYILKVNKYFLELLDCKQDEVIGEHISKFGAKENTTYTSTTGESVHIDNKFFEDTMKMYEGFVEEKKTINQQSYFVSKNNRLIPVEQSMSFFHDEKGNVAGALAIIRDITKRLQADQQLIASRDFLENIIESSLDSIVVIDKRGLLSRANKAFLKLLGFSEAEVLGKHMSEFAPMSEGTYECTTGETIQLNEEYSNQVEANMLLFQEKGRMQNAVSYMLRKDNIIVPVEDNMVYLLDKEGKRTGAVAITRDITERKKAEKQIQKTSKYLENIFKTSVDGIIIADDEGRISAVNKATEKIFDCSSDQLVGKPLREMEFDAEKFKVSGKELMDRLLSEGTISGVERKWKKPDGSFVVVEMNIALLKDDKGKMNGSVSSIRDITDRQRTEEALKESEEKYHNLIENAHDAIISLTMEGEIIDINKSAEEMFGYSPEEIAGKPAYLLVAEQHREKQKEVKKEINEGVTEVFFDDTIIEGNGLKKNGEKFFVEVSYFLYEVQGTKIIAAIIRNISKRKEEEQRILNYQQQLKSLTSKLILSEQKERQHFADFLHDEVGQQLFATRLQLEQLKNSLSSDENTKVLDKALNNLYQVMNQTRSLTTELSSPILKQLGLEKALEWLAEQTHKKYDITVTFEDDKEEKPLDDNTKILLFQSVSELLTNVAKHARTKNASLSINRNTSTVEIRVKDSGVGFLIPDRDSTDIKIEGLGLFRIKERLEPLGGQMEIESQPNHGTRITLSVPLSDSV